jgi:aspartate aminotransferase
MHGDGEAAAPQGAYRDDNGKPVVLECVREAEKRIMGRAFME